MKYLIKYLIVLSATLANADETTGRKLRCLHRYTKIISKNSFSVGKWKYKYF